MNRVNIICLFACLGLLVSPSLTAPADNEAAETNDKGSPEIEQEPPNPSKNEIESNLDDDVENFKPEKGSSDGETDVSTDTSSFSGVSTGVISRIGVDGPFECRYLTCPNGTQTCKYTSKYSPNGKTADVKYECFSSDGTVLLNETKTEQISDQDHGVISIDSFFSDFTRRMNSFLNDILKSFQ